MENDDVVGDIDEEEDEEAIIERRRREREQLLQVSLKQKTRQKILFEPMRKKTMICF
jgi:hypothetical protein